MESSAILSWRGGIGGNPATGRFLIVLLLDDARIVSEGSTGTAFDEEMMQVDQSCYRNARLTRLHASAGDGSSIHAATTVITPG